MVEFRPFNDVLYTDLQDITKEEVEAYKQKVKADNNGTLDNVVRIDVRKVDENNVILSYETKINEPKFERLRRITGYLTTTLDRWNDGKRAEEKDRVKHA